MKKLNNNEGGRIKSYKFLSDCDKLVGKIRIPRERFRIIVRKQGKKVIEKLLESTDQFNKVFENIQTISNDFVKEIDNGQITEFSNFFSRFNSQITEYNEKIPTLKREIRKFGIY